MAISRVLSANVRFIVRHSRLIPPTLCPKSPTTLVCSIIFVKLSIIGSHPPCWSSPAWFMKSAWHPPKLFSVWKLSMCPLSIFIYLLFFKVEKSFLKFFIFENFLRFCSLEFFELMVSITNGFFYIPCWRTMNHSERYSRRPLLSPINIILGSSSWAMKLWKILKNFSKRMWTSTWVWN